jgi:hypothetical protein
VNNEQNSIDEALPPIQSRRDFTIKSILAAVGVGASSLMQSQQAQAGDAKNQAAYGNGTFLVEGMAAYEQAGPLRLIKF